MIAFCVWILNQDTSKVSRSVVIGNCDFLGLFDDVAN